MCETVSDAVRVPVMRQADARADSAGRQASCLRGHAAQGTTDLRSPPQIIVQNLSQSIEHGGRNENLRRNTTCQVKCIWTEDVAVLDMLAQISIRHHAPAWFSVSPRGVPGCRRDCG